MSYEVWADGKCVGKFSKEQDANDWAKSVAGTVKPVPETQDASPTQEKLTQ